VHWLKVGNQIVNMDHIVWIEAATEKDGSVRLAAWTDAPSQNGNTRILRFNGEDANNFIKEFEAAFFVRVEPAPYTAPGSIRLP